MAFCGRTVHGGWEETKPPMYGRRHVEILVMAMTFSVKWEARASLRGGRKGDFFEVEERGVSMKQSSRKA